jgi:hypothetical protein
LFNVGSKMAAGIQIAGVVCGAESAGTGPLPEYQADNHARNEPADQTNENTAKL